MVYHNIAICKTSDHMFRNVLNGYISTVFMTYCNCLSACASIELGLGVKFMKLLC